MLHACLLHMHTRREVDNMWKYYQHFIIKKQGFHSTWCSGQLVISHRITGLISGLYIQRNCCLSSWTINTNNIKVNMSRRMRSSVKLYLPGPLSVTLSVVVSVPLSREGLDRAVFLWMKPCWPPAPIAAVLGPMAASSFGTIEPEHFDSFVMEHEYIYILHLIWYLLYLSKLITL